MSHVRRHPAMAGSFEAICRSLFTSWCRLSVTGCEHLPAEPFIICSNHQSHLDSLALMAAAGRRFGDFGLLAAQDYFFERPAARRLFSPFLNLIPVARTPDARGLQRTLALCREFVVERRGNLIIYPEGGRSRTGDLQPFKAGFALLSAELGMPIVPAYVKGTSAVMPPGAAWPKPGRIEVRFGPPLPRQVSIRRLRRQQMERAVLDLEERVHELRAMTGD
jgi:1-acyl-sn-glycerol-3-phosphate acyltransferase